MSRLMFVYLSGTEKGKTRIFTQAHVTIGTTDSADLKLVPEEGGTFPSDILADVYDDGGMFHMVARGPFENLTLTINGDGATGRESAAGYALRDGDSILVV